MLDLENALTSVVMDFPCIERMINTFLQETYPEKAVKPMTRFETVCKSYDLWDVVSMASQGVAFDWESNGIYGDRRFSLDAPYFAIVSGKFVSLTEYDLPFYYGMQNGIDLAEWMLSHMDEVFEEALEAVMAWIATVPANYGNCEMFFREHLEPFLPEAMRNRAVFKEMFSEPNKVISRYCQKRLEKALREESRTDLPSWLEEFTGRWNIPASRSGSDSMLLTLADGSQMTSVLAA